MNIWRALHAGCKRLQTVIICRLCLKCDGTRAENRFRLSAKRTSPFKSAGASVQSTTGSWVVRISSSNGCDAGYTMFRGSVQSTIYPLHSPVSPSIPLPCVSVCHHDSTGLYYLLLFHCNSSCTNAPQCYVIVHSLSIHYISVLCPSQSQPRIYSLMTFSPHFPVPCCYCLVEGWPTPIDVFLQRRKIKLFVYIVRKIFVCFYNTRDIWRSRPSFAERRNRGF
jgi:hypothetical protein